MTFEKAAGEVDEIDKWARNVPRVTITHLGTDDIAVIDLASQGNKLRTEYPRWFLIF